MKKIIAIILFAVFISSCSSKATPETSVTPSATPYAGKWYGELSEEVINETTWTPKDADTPQAYELHGEPERVTNPLFGYEFVQNESEITENNIGFIEKDGKLFLSYYGLLYYFPKDLNPEMIRSVDEWNHRDLSIAIYRFNAGDFRVIEKVEIQE